MNSIGAKPGYPNPPTWSFRAGACAASCGSIPTTASCAARWSIRSARAMRQSRYHTIAAPEKYCGVFLLRLDSGAMRIPNTHRVALAIKHGLELCSTGGDFSRFDGLRSASPLRQLFRPGNDPSRLHNLLLSKFTPATRLRNFCRAAHRAVWLNPQSGANDSRSAGAYCRQRRTRAATSSGVSM